MPPGPGPWLADFRVDRAVLAVFLEDTIGLDNALPGGGKTPQGVVPFTKFSQPRPVADAAVSGVKGMVSHASSAIAR